MTAHVKASQGEFASLLTVGHISLGIVDSFPSLRDIRSKDIGDIRMVVDEGTTVKYHALRNISSLAYKTEHLSGPHTSIPDPLISNITFSDPNSIKPDLA
jgi:hypothetical protein